MKHPKKLETTPEISKRMANVKLKNGTAEVMLAKELWKNGIRYRKNYRKLPGSPDIAITKQKIAVFVDGEFWHGKDWEIKKEKLKNNRKYWIEKIEENIKRDKRVNTLLIENGWKVIRFWETEVLKDLDNCVKEVLELLSR